MNEVNNNQLINNELDNQTISQDEELLKIFVGKSCGASKSFHIFPLIGLVVFGAIRMWK